MGIFSKRRGAGTPPPPPAAPDGLTFSEPTPSERAWMDGHLALAAEFGFDVHDLDQITHFYELLLGSWTDSPPQTRSDPNTSVNAIGTVFGEHLVRATSLRWVIATDASGTELALHDEATGLLVHPANLVAKRWAAGEDGTFLRHLGDEIVRRVGPGA